MNSKQITYIFEVAKTGNFNSAAENLFVSQPTLTYQIKAAEQEIGFRIFDRSGKGSSLTPAGAQFCDALRRIRAELAAAIEQGQNFSTKYSEDISIAMMTRSVIHFLPEAIRRFSKTSPFISITPRFSYGSSLDLFLRGEADMLLAPHPEVRHLPDVKIYPLFDSKVYLITKPEDPLAQKELIQPEDLTGRTLMVGGGSPPALRSVQKRLIQSGAIQYFNSHDHETTLTNIAADRGVCLAPGFLNDHTGEFAWTPFACSESFPCSLCTHSADTRESVQSFVTLLQEIYQEQSDFPV